MVGFKPVVHPNVYEVNTRVLSRHYSQNGQRATLLDIPEEYWRNLAERGMNYVWLMGVWTLKEIGHNPAGLPDHMREEFAQILPDLTDEDIDGSPYAIEDYEVDPILGGEEELVKLRAKLRELGLGLILDFIPNHFGAHTHWLHSYPEYFIEVGESAWNIDQTTFYSPKTAPGKYFGHGKDPYFDAWQDTIQVDYAFDGTRDFMTRNLIKVAGLCDAVRCDMAMLPVKRIFDKTWGSYVQWQGEEFWPGAIAAVKEEYPDFKLIAECYWDMEGELLDMGFDYCYDKTFYDRLEDAESLNAHFNADMWFLDKTTRFLENHDEHRAAGKLDLSQHMAAAALFAFSPGMRLWHMGQWEGRRIKIPVQLNRLPHEVHGSLLQRGNDDVAHSGIREFYQNLTTLISDPLFLNGSWQKLNYSDDQPELFCWQWTLNDEKRILLVNYSSSQQSFSREHLESLAGVELTLNFPAAESQPIITEIFPWETYLWEAKR